MLTIPAGLRVYLCVEPTDMRKSFDTLAALVRDKCQRSLETGSPAHLVKPEC